MLFRAFTTGELLSAMAASSRESTDFCHSPLPIFRLSITLSYKLPSAVQIHWVLKVRISERICLICGRARAGIIATGNESHVGIFLFGRLDDGYRMGSETEREGEVRQFRVHPFSESCSTSFPSAESAQNADNRNPCGNLSSEREMRQASLLATEAEQGQDGEGERSRCPPCSLHH